MNLCTIIYLCGQTLCIAGAFFNVIVYEHPGSAIGLLYFVQKKIGGDRRTIISFDVNSLVDFLFQDIFESRTLLISTGLMFFPVQDSNFLKL